MKILTKEQCETILQGSDHRLSKAEKDAQPTLGDILNSHEALREKLERIVSSEIAAAAGRVQQSAIEYVIGVYMKPEYEDAYNDLLKFIADAKTLATAFMEMEK